MKQDLSLDFGTAIAYLVPGVIAARAVSFIHPTLRQLFHYETDGSSELARFALLTLVGMAVGLIVSAVRAAVIDMSFAVSLRVVRTAIKKVLPGQTLKEAADQSLTYLDQVLREDPAFPKLAIPGRLEAYLEAKAADKRPYQFYGNLIVALVMLIGSTLLEYGTLPSSSPILLWAGYVVAVGFLYFAARRSHFRYMKSVREFNALP